MTVPIHSGTFIQNGYKFEVYRTRQFVNGYLQGNTNQLIINR